MGVRVSRIVLIYALSLLMALVAGGLLSGCDPEWKNLTTAQKLEDFHYLFSVLEDNHPYLSLKARVEEYDWLSHKQEFEQATKDSADDKGFAQVIAGMLKQINNGHTGILPWTGAGGARDMADWNGEPWRRTAKQTSAGRADYWYRLAYEVSDDDRPDRYPPFIAIYNDGRYAVVATAPEEAIRQCVRPGMVVLEIEGVPIQDYVDGQRGLGTSRLLYDPVRRHLYQRQLTLPLEGEFLRVTLADEAGRSTEVAVPYAKSAWDSDYAWPPKYSGNLDSPNRNLYTDVLGDGKVGYVRISSFLPVEQDASALHRFFESIRDLPALIIDIRGNGGGKSTYWEQNVVARLATGPVECNFYLTWRSGEYVQPFIQAKISRIPLQELSKSAFVERAGPQLAGNIPSEILTAEYAEPRVYRYVVTPRDSINYQGRIFVLVDDLCFSAADGFAAFCKGSGFATVVGTWTRGDGVAFTPAVITLPNSGMVVRFPSFYGLNPDFSASEETHTSPDVMVEPSLDDILEYLATRDSSGELRPDPSFDTQLRMCLVLALSEPN
jgi:hypothetical protein